MNETAAQRPRSQAMAWAVLVALALVALVATLLGNVLILERFSDAARPDDLLFILLPHVRPLRWLTVVALVVGFGVFAVELLRRQPWRLPAVGSVVALMYLFRAGMMVLTPLAPAQGDQHFVFEVQQYGMFPSGHTAVLTVLALLTPAECRWQRRLLWAMVVVMVVSLVLARGHYSIDIVGGLLVAYFIVKVWQSGRLFAPISAVTGR